jgi:hypothetical protein
LICTKTTLDRYSFRIVIPFAKTWPFFPAETIVAVLLCVVPAFST